MEYRRAGGGTASNLDRKDSAKPYEMGNIVVCCRRCNYAKNTFFTYDEWKQIGTLIRSWKHPESIPDATGDSNELGGSASSYHRNFDSTQDAKTGHTECQGHPAVPAGTHAMVPEKGAIENPNSPYYHPSYLRTNWSR
jgi:hypothetical protein